MSDEKLSIDSEFIRLDDLLKLAGLCMTGGEAKRDIQMGFVRVNGQICIQRGRKLRPGDTVLFNGHTIVVN